MKSSPTKITRRREEDGLLSAIKKGTGEEGAENLSPNFNQANPRREKLKSLTIHL